MPQYIAWTTTLSNDARFAFIYSYRRMGEDNGMDTVVHLGNNLQMAYRRFDIMLNKST